MAKFCDYVKTDSEKQSWINNTVRYIGFNIFGSKKGKYKFINAYEKLAGRVYLDWNFKLSEKPEGKTMFDKLSSEELDMVYQSAIRLSDMYNVVLSR